MSVTIVSLTIYINLFLLISTYASIKIDWKAWINLPIPNAQTLTTIYNDDIVVLGGTNWNNSIPTLYKINASLITTKSESTKWTSHEIKDGYPGAIEIKNDNFVTIGPNTYIFGPTTSMLNSVYQFNHEQYKFVPRDEIDIKTPPTEAANPCVVYAPPYIYVIGGTTHLDSQQISCSSNTAGYNLDTRVWETYSTEMTWSKQGSCYHFCQYYEGFIYLFGGVIDGEFPTYLDGVFALDIS